jgi:hypothetical protein
MGESLKATLGGVIFLGLIGAFIVWAGKGIPLTPLVWSLRFLLPLLVFASAAALIWAARRPDRAPDFIRRFFRRPFERNGGCFYILPSVRDGICYLNVAFQNQYEKPCHLRVVAQSPIEPIGIAIDIPCAGGAFGLIRVPIAVPAKLQGKSVSFNVSAATNYSSGKGQLLRFKNGMRVGQANSSGLGTAAVTLGLLTVGVLAVGSSHPASATLPLPTSVAESLPPNLQPDLQTLWTPGNAKDVTIDDVQRALTNSPDEAQRGNEQL